jgi:predicted dinucleotide-binding enzyme
LTIMTTAIIGTGRIGSVIARQLASGGEALRLASTDSESARTLAGHGYRSVRGGGVTRKQKPRSARSQRRERERQEDARYRRLSASARMLCPL